MFSCWFSYLYMCYRKEGAQGTLRLHRPPQFFRCSGLRMSPHAARMSFTISTSPVHKDKYNNVEYPQGLSSRKVVRTFRRSDRDLLLSLEAAAGFAEMFFSALFLSALPLPTASGLCALCLHSSKCHVEGTYMSINNIPSGFAEHLNKNRQTVVSVLVFKVDSAFFNFLYGMGLSPKELYL